MAYSFSVLKYNHTVASSYLSKPYRNTSTKFIPQLFFVTLTSVRNQVVNLIYKFHALVIWK